MVAQKGRMLQAQQGWTFMETLIALGLIGVLAAMLVPGLIENAGQRQALSSAKEVAADLMRARNKYRTAAADPSIPPLAKDLANLTKFTQTTVNCGGGIPTRPFNFTGNASDCFRYANGGVLEAEQVAGALPDQLRFNYYPKGTARGDMAISLRLYYDAQRLTTYGADVNDATKDPDWAKDWTMMN